MNRLLQNNVVWLLGLLLTLFYWFLSLHIDFHPDEAIYFDAIPFSVRNDAGVFFSAFYLTVTHWVNGPEGARLASAMLAGATFVALVEAVRLKYKLSLVKITILFILFTLSYQAIFVFVRVRPEAAWWFCAAVVLYAMLRYEASRQQSKEKTIHFFMVVFVVMLLPMNHRLSWFVCFFLLGYALLFMLREKDWQKAVYIGLALLAGVVLNIVLRAWMADVSMSEAFRVALSSPGGQRQSIGEFLKHVFYGAPLFLNDMAQNPNLYEWITGYKERWLSHAFIQNSLWLLLFIFPLMGRTWNERYVFTFPLFALAMFWLSGYYNPTYAAGFSLFCVLIAAYIWLSQSGWRQKFAMMVMLVSIVNGLSFVATRVLNHGDASYFKMEKTVRDIALSMKAGEEIALPERFTPAVSGLPLSHYVNFKNKIPQNVDVLVIDSYDGLMYGFVPDFGEKKKALSQLAQNMCLFKRIETPVYDGDRLFSSNLSETEKRPSSWFFRNSAAYSLSIYRQCKTTP